MGVFEIMNVKKTSHLGKLNDCLGNSAGFFKKRYTEYVKVATGQNIKII